MVTKYMNKVINFFIIIVNICWYAFKTEGKHQVTHSQATSCGKILQNT